MTDTQNTPGPLVLGDTFSHLDKDFFDVVAPGWEFTAHDGVTKHNLVAQYMTEENARLFIRLWNLHFAGTAIAEKRTADVLANGDIPADPDYGLTENEIAAARMMNALMDENAELLKALEDVAGWVGGMCGCRADDEYHNKLLAVIAIAKGET